MTSGTRGRSVLLLCVLGIVALVATGCGYVYGPTLPAIDAPVVLTGADLPAGLGLDPSRGVAYRYEPDHGWVQIPLQIDERVEVDFGRAPPDNAAPGVDGTVYGAAGLTDVTALQYADPDTFVGADSDPTLDADDELVFMARDVGPRAPVDVAGPASTSGAGIEIEVSAGGGAPGFAYLFYGPPGVDQSAGADYVDYEFALGSGDYKTTYLRNDGPNPESSTAGSDLYTLGFSDRWFTDTLHLPGGPDILDGLKARTNLESCGRSNVTFADAEGAFAANIDGPVRAIRSYVGANSGPRTQQTVVMYRQRVEVITDLRVHQLGGVAAFVDLSAAAIGAEYGSSELDEPVVVDGSPDAVPTTVPSFEWLRSDDGVMLWSGAVETSFDVSDDVEQLYADTMAPTIPECWGDGAFLGASGQVVAGPIPNTDPFVGPAETLQARQVFSFWPSSLDADAWGPVWTAAASNGLETTLGLR